MIETESRRMRRLDAGGRVQHVHTAAAKPVNIRWSGMRGGLEGARGVLTRTTVVVAAACLVVTGLAGTATATSGGISGQDVGTANTSSEEIPWRGCAERAGGDAALQCAQLSVPADWHRPDGALTAIGLEKLPAQNPEQRVGSLLVNLGGPGPTNLPESRGKLSELTRWFDVIAFDPRGMGTSGGITCPPAPYPLTPMFSTGQQTWRQFARHNRAWEAACQPAAGPLAGNLDAWQVAHDMETIRAALGEGGLTYYGNSYGTVYGQTYANLFPTKVYRMYLDSVANHTARTPLPMVAPMATVVRDKFQQFDHWCQTTSACAVHPEDAQKVWDELLAHAGRHPLPAPGAGPGKTVGPDQLRTTTFSAVFAESRWPQFAEALAQARTGDASQLYTPTPPTQSDTTVSTQAWCSDFPFTQDWAGMARLEHQLRAIAPRVGWLMARFQYGRCAGLQHQGSFPPHRIDPDTGLPPVLLVNGLDDPSTPPGAGRAVANQLPGSAWIGANTGHAVYLDGNRCTRDIVHRYLRTGTLPTPGRICPANKPESAEQTPAAAH